jgi:hypothetical protein
MKITFAAVLLALAGLNASAGVISLNPSTLTPGVGDTFTVNLGLSSNTDEIIAFGFDYSVSSSAISLTGATVNPFFSDDSALFSGDPQIVGDQFPGDTDSSFTLVSFTFQANSAGPAVFRITSDVLGDANEGLFSLTSPAADLTSQVTINVTPGAVTPEPATFGIGAMAVAGLFLATRRLRT